MRRIPTALVISLTSALAPLVPPVDARGATPAVPIAAPVSAADVRAYQAQQRHLARERVTTHRLTLVAQSRGVSVSQLRTAWQHVAVCEVGGNWAMTGPTYSGIGFLNTVWAAFGGRQYAPLAGRATRDQQILIAMRVTGGWVPDQNGCSTSGW